MEQFKNIHPDIKIAICEWFGKNIDRFQRINSCCNEFRSYLYDADGNYLIGGKEIGEFIRYIDKAF